MSYKLSSTNQVQHIESSAWIPARFVNGVATALDEHSPFVKEFFAWVVAGNTPTLFPPPTQAELDNAARKATDATEAAAHKIDNQVANFLNMTPAALDAWVDTNIGAAGITLAQLKTNCSIVLKVLGRLAQDGARGRTLRNGT